MTEVVLRINALVYIVAIAIRNLRNMRNYLKPIN